MSIRKDIHVHLQSSETTRADAFEQPISSCFVQRGPLDFFIAHSTFSATGNVIYSSYQISHPLSPPRRPRSFPLLSDHVYGFDEKVEIPPYEAEDLFMLLDVDQNGTVSCDEFMEGCMRVNGDAKALS